MQDRFLQSHRYFLWLLTACFAAFLLWLFLARVDVVMIAEGKLVPDGFIQQVQAPEDSRVVRVVVKDGEQVEEGADLVELDTGYSRADVASSQAEVQSLSDRLERTRAELANRVPQVSDPQVLAEYRQRVEHHRAQQEEARRVLEQADSDLRTTVSRGEKVSALLPVAERQAGMLERLKAEGFVSEAAYNEKLLGAIDTRQELEVQRRERDTAQAQVRAAQAGLARIVADYRRQLAVEQTEIELRLRQAQANLSKQEHRAGLQVIRAPQGGQVTGLKVHNPGQQLTQGAEVLSIVPAGQPLRFEGWLRNEDTAFVALGMPAKVKLAAYPFQRYGWLTGKLTWLGADSETPDSMRNGQGEPLFYRIRIELDAQHLTPESGRIALRAGLQAVGDIQVGRRSIFEYLTSPMRKVALEAARER